MLVTEATLHASPLEKSPMVVCLCLPPCLHCWRSVAWISGSGLQGLQSLTCSGTETANDVISVLDVFVQDASFTLDIEGAGPVRFMCMLCTPVHRPCVGTCWPSVCKYTCDSMPRHSHQTR
jgi:hypothetical protein